MFFVLNIMAFIGNLIICPILAGILFRQWFNSEKRFYSDLPFLIGISLISATIDNSDSLLGFIYNWQSNTISSIISISGMILTICVMLIIILEIWLSEKARKIRLTIIISFGIFLEIFALSVLPFLPELIYGLINLGLVIPMGIIFGISFFYCYKNERLPNVNPFYIGIGFSILAFSFILKTLIFATMDPISYVFPAIIFVAYFIDIMAYSFALYGFTHPARYGKKTIMS